MKKIIMVCILFLLAPSSYAGSDDFSHKCFLLDFIGNIPKQPIGFCVATIRPRSLGLFLSAKLSLPPFPPDNETYDNISIHKAEDIFHDKFMGTKKYGYSLSIGITRTISANSAIYLAPGLTWTDTYRQYYDKFEILGQNGEYLLKDDTEMQPSISAGFILTASKGINMILGADIQPLGIDLGIGKTF
jgi:hypothetical protein